MNLQRAFQQIAQDALGQIPVIDMDSTDEVSGFAVHILAVGHNLKIAGFLSDRLFTFVCLLAGCIDDKGAEGTPVHQFALASP